MQNNAHLKPLNWMFWIYGKYEKIEVWRRLGRVLTKTLVAQTIPSEIFEIK